MVEGLQVEWVRLRAESPPGHFPAAVLKRLIKISFATLLGATGITGFLLVRILRARGMALVVGYHGVTRRNSDPLDGGHSVSHLAGQLRFLSRWLRPVRLEEIAGPVARGEAPPPGTFAVTFDDGLVNNLRLAVPLLSSPRIPATFFVPSSLVGSERDLWILSLRELLRRWPHSKVPPEPGLWPELSMRSPLRRYAAFFRIKEVLKRCEDRREEILSRLSAGAGTPLRPPESDRVMGLAELRQLFSGGFTVGAHSRNHPILSHLDEGLAREEVAGSRRDLEGLLGAPVIDFAYPNGRFSDVGENTRRLAAEAGYRCAVLTEPGMVHRGDDPLALRRCMPENVPAFRAGFDLLVRAWKDRNRPGDASQPISRRASVLAAARGDRST